MTIHGATRLVLLAVALAAAPAAASAVAAAAGGASAEAEVHPAYTAYVAPDPGDDPRLYRTGEEERTLREVGDAVFSRPFHVVRLVAGIVAFPVALPIAALFADWHDAVDICVTGPWEMAFVRPLGE